MEKEIKGVLNEWEVFCDSKIKGKHFHLSGNLDNKGNIITARVISIIENIVETKDSKYELGFPKRHIYDIMNERG